MKSPCPLLPRRVLGASLVFVLGCCAALRAELLVVVGSTQESFNGVDRYDDSTGAPRGSFYATNEGWFGLCRGPTGEGYVIGNTLGEGDLYGIDPDGHVMRGPLAFGPDVPDAIAFGPDGNFYGAGSLNHNWSERGIVRFEGKTGAPSGTYFVAPGAGGTAQLGKFAFGPDHNLYVISDLGIVRFRGDTGTFMDVFVPLGSGGLAAPSALIFGPDGHLYVASDSGNSVKRFSGASGAFLGDFIAPGAGGLSHPADLAYGPDGRLYVASYGSKQVLRFDATSGAFQNVFLATAKGPRLIAFSQAPAETVWFDDTLPPGAVGGAAGGDAWNWVSGPSAPDRTDGPAYGSQAHRSASVSGPGVHEHFFNFAQPFPIAAGDVLYAYVFVPSSDEPDEIMLSWCDGSSWEHRAFWGYDIINAGTSNTDGRRNMGRLTGDYVGRWVRLEIPASLVGLEGQSIQGMSFTLLRGSATWDRVGKIGTAPVAPPPAPQPSATTTVWFEDGFPNGASAGATSGAWTWMSSTPAPQTGTMALYSTLAAGLHEQYFNFAWDPLALAAGDKFYLDVYVDPASPPREIVLSFCADNWEHRAYWGENLLSYAADNTPAQHRVGALPAAGQWVRLEVPAGDVGLAGQAVQGLSISLYDGRVTFDQAGKVSP